MKILPARDFMSEPTLARYERFDGEDEAVIETEAVAPARSATRARRRTSKPEVKPATTRRTRTAKMNGAQEPKAPAPSPDTEQHVLVTDLGSDLSEEDAVFLMRLVKTRDLRILRMQEKATAHEAEIERLVDLNADMHDEIEDLKYALAEAEKRADVEQSWAGVTRWIVRHALGATFAAGGVFVAFAIVFL